jgi:hypothetical protein
MNALSPSARRPGCPALVPIGGDGTCGYCNVQRRHVYLEASDRCLCDFCTPAPDGTRRVSPDVYFAWNDIVMLRSEHAARLADETQKAAAVPCAPRTPKKLTPEAPKPAPPKKPGLLAFT